MQPRTPSRPRALLALILLVLAAPAAALQPATAPPSAPAYFPPAGAWEHKKPSEVGMDDAMVAEAVEWAKTQETDWPKDFSTQEKTFGKLLGPIPKTRAGTNGVIIRHGYIIAEFGDTAAVDPTYSCAKSYLSTILGLTIDRGMIRSVNDKVGDTVKDGGYDVLASAHNARITWDHHATQTSEWEGEMFGKPSTFIGKEAFGEAERKPREIREPGTYYEYNDVRVNRFALSLLRLWKRPLPEVLKSEIMDKIGASGTWNYIPYDNATVEIDGKPMKSISGGTRWGGGLWISTLDHARFGYLMLRKGEWDGTRVISEKWISEATRQQGVEHAYGYLWWLNTPKKKEPGNVAEPPPPGSRWPAAPASSFAAVGAGSNTVWVDPEHDLVVVWRWHKGGAEGELFKRLLAALKPR